MPSFSSSRLSILSGPTGKFVAGSYFTRLLGVVSMVIVGRAAGVEVRGLFGTANALAEGGGRAGAMGIPEKAARLVSAGESARAHSLSRLALRWSVAGALLSGAYSFWATHSAAWALVGAALGMGGTQRLLWRNIRAAKGDLHRVLLSEALPPIAAIATLALRLGRESSALWFAAASGSVLIALCALVGGRHSGTNERLDRVEVSDLGFWTAGLSNFIVNRADILIVAALLGEFDAGIFATAASVSFLTIQFGTSVGQASLAQEPPTRAEVTRSSLTLVSVSAGIAAAGAAVMWIGLELIFGADFEPARIVALILLAGAPFASLSMLHHQQLVLLGGGGLSASVQAASAALVLTAVPLCCYRYGVEGAAVATSTIYVLRSAFSTVAVRALARRAGRSV